MTTRPERACRICEASVAGSEPLYPLPICRGCFEKLPRGDRRIISRATEFAWSAAKALERADGIVGHHARFVRRERAFAGLPTGVKNTLIRAGYESAEQAKQATDKELLSVWNLGRRGIAAIRNAGTKEGARS